VVGNQIDDEAANAPNLVGCPFWSHNSGHEQETAEIAKTAKVLCDLRVLRGSL
jgi:hypothetical protein